MAKSFGRLADEFAAVSRKQDIRLLKLEKEMYSFWRTRKAIAIEHARNCKKLGLYELQKRWEKKVAEYAEDANASKKRIRQLGKHVYR